MNSILLVKKFLELAEMMSGLVNASFSLPEWQVVKMFFFALWNNFEWKGEREVSSNISNRRVTSSNLK